MRKVATITVSLALVALMAVPALAKSYGRGGGFGPGNGPGWMQSMTPEQQAKLSTARAAYLKDTLELRKQMMLKGMELRTLNADPKANKAKVLKLANELVDLRAQIAKKRNQHFAGLPVGPGFERGGKNGRGGYGPGYHMGSRGGYGPGSRQGRGGYGGYGPGSCWR